MMGPGQRKSYPGARTPSDTSGALTRRPHISGALLIPQLLPVCSLFGCFAAPPIRPPVVSPGQALPAPPDVSRRQLAG